MAHCIGLMPCLPKPVQLGCHLGPRATLADHEQPPITLPAQEIPGSYGPPLLGSFQDRFNYFWLQGRDDFFLTKIKLYNSTVIRVNMPPGPPFFPDSRAIMLLDQKSIRVLFDTSKVDKTNAFAGTYMPSTDFTGGFRVLPYLDPSEKNHAPLKNFCFEILRSNGKKWLPEFQQTFEEAAAEWEAQLGEKGSAEFAGVCEQFTLDFLFRSVVDKDPAAPGEVSLGMEGPKLIQAWLALQISPQVSVGLPPPVEELLHTFPLPFELVRPQYEKVYRFLRVHGECVLDMAEEKFGLDRSEACHNLLFFLCFNTWGGLQLLLPSVIKRIGAAGWSLQRELAAEVRGAVESEGALNMRALAGMELVHSTVYEVLRMDPPVPFQYGRAKQDLMVESHDCAYKVRKGELLGCYQKIAMRDPRVFVVPDSFQPKRFMGEEGKALLHSLTWSNGPETQDPSLANKQCPGKDFVNLVARLFVAQLFLRYDFFRIRQHNRSVAFTTLKKRAATP